MTSRNREYSVLLSGPGASSLSSPSSLLPSASVVGGSSSSSSSNHGGSSSNSSSSNSTSVQVAVRIRPVTTHDQSSIPARWQRHVVIPHSTNALLVESGGPPPSAAATASPAPASNKKQSFTFDRVIPPDDGQEQVYANSVRPLIGRFLEGYNVTILAYGQTSSGKSYTMGTSVADVDFEALVAGQRPDPQTGIIPRAVADIFGTIKQQQARSGAVQYSAKASFIEIYNEELIDLLADADGDHRPLVQIREDKQGHIIWSGLREVRVNNVADVMNHLLQGSTIRRTNETDMNAQSSRSHAIFSLTLVQRKFVGNGAPPPPSSTFSAANRPGGVFGGRTTPTGRTTPSGRSGLPRPTSNIPTPGGTPAGSRISRAGTPSSSSLRPASVAAAAGNARSHSPMFGSDRDPVSSMTTEGNGEWITVTSKFHFVDLAGSERLKRTAAMGERVKEGISINSGLHALGNVISALGDPAKARRTTHIPYRDSKLTRLLQDSLGGNAYTLMIACVSPTEYNVSETINTLQYANRARNIKNKAELNQVEVGWDDVDYLQSQVMKLRKELTILRGFKSGMPGSDSAMRAMDQKEVLEWREKYASLSQKHSQLTADMTKLQQNHRSSPLSSPSTNADFLEAAEPIIVEYEKTVDALEGQINLMKAALGHSEDVIMEAEGRQSENETRITQLEQDLETREQTVTELQARLAKLQDRESSANTYARDLEARLVSHTSDGDVNAQMTAELRKEVTRLREAEASTEEYIKDLEARLQKADDSVESMRDQVARLERDLERRDEAYKELQLRLDSLDDAKLNKALLEELDQRDTRLLDLQTKVEKLQGEKDEVTRERGRLTDSAASHELERGKLQDRIQQLEQAAKAAAVTAEAGGSMAGFGTNLKSGSVSSFNTAGATTPREETNGDEELEHLRIQVEMYSNELDSKKEDELKLHADLETINVKYKEALAEIQDLSQQIAEAKVRGETPGANRQPEEVESPTLSRRGSMNLRGRDSLLADPGPARRRSLSRRSSGSFLYNPRESTPREGSSNATATATATRSPVGGPMHGGSSADESPLRQRTLSLSTSDSYTGRGKRPLSLSGSSDFAKLGIVPGVPQSADSSPTHSNKLPDSPANYERKIASLEKEAMRLQEVLHERDEEIAALERAAREGNSNSNRHEVVPTDAATGAGAAAASLLSPPSTTRNAAAGLQTSGVTPPLTPATEREISVVRQLVSDSHSDGAAVGANVDELMRSMARKEMTSRQQMDDLRAELEKHRREHETLQTLSRDQAANMALEIENLRAQLAASSLAAAKKEAVNGDDSTRDADIKEQLEALRREHNGAMTARSEEHTAALAELTQAKAAALARQAEEHQQASQSTMEEALQKLRDLHTEEMQAKELHHGETVVQARGEGERALTAAAEERALAIKQSKEQHETLLTKALADKDAAHAEALSSMKADFEGQVKSIRADHSSALEKLKEEHGAILSKRATEHAAVIDALHEEHARSLGEGEAETHTRHRQALIAVETKLAEEHRVALDELQTRLTMEHEAALEEHGDRLKTLTQEHEDALSRMKAEHQRQLSEMQTAHESAIGSLREVHDKGLSTARNESLASATETHSRAIKDLSTNHADALAKMSEEHSSAMETLRQELSKGQADHSTAAQNAKRDIERLEKNHIHTLEQLEALKAEHADRLAVLSDEHSSRSADLQRDLDMALRERAELEDKYMKLLEQDPHDIDALRSELSETNDALVTLEEALSETQVERDRLVAEVEQLREAVPGQHSTAPNGTSSKDGHASAAATVAQLKKETELLQANLSNVRSELMRSKSDIQSLVEERARQESLHRETQIKLTIAETRANNRSRGGGASGDNDGDTSSNSSSAAHHNGLSSGSISRSPISAKRNSEQTDPGSSHSDARSSKSLGVGGGAKPPPLTPPPNVPPPPTPNGGATTPTQRHSGLRNSGSSIMTRPDSPSQSLQSGPLSRSSSVTSISNSLAASDPKVAKLLADQAEELKSLAKQLNHCEMDLQANIDLVATLEAALNDSERNLRKSRVQLSEAARERDRYAAQADELRVQVSMVQKENDAVKNNVMLEKQGYESRLQAEREAKDRARRALEQRLEEVQKKKNSKLFCM